MINLKIFGILVELKNGNFNKPFGLISKSKKYL